MAYFDRKDDYGYVRWADEVRRRDHYTCVICGRRGVAVNSHHLNAWASFPDQRYDLGNGVCLCQDCHVKFHDTYGKGKNTKEQFEEFKNIMETLISLANKDAEIEYSLRKMLQEEAKKEAIEEILKDLQKYHDE
jgi:ABC-type uncharacterized transport system ATPase subunit